MQIYLIKRLLLIPVSLLAIITINFFIIQLSPGGPIENIVMKDAEGSQNNEAEIAASKTASESIYRDGGGTRSDLILELKQQFGFDKPLHERYFQMIKNYLLFDFGDSFYRSISVIDLIKEKLPVSISIGVFSTIIIYSIAIFLGITKALCYNSKFDIITSWIITICYSIPSFLFAVLLIILFCGGNYFNWFPFGGLISQNWYALSWFDKIIDYLHHITLPIIAITIGGFAGLTILIKNLFLEEISKNYHLIAQAKGLSIKQSAYKHVFRNAMLIVISQLPHAIIGMIFAGSAIIEMIFSLDGLGLLMLDSTRDFDYPVMFGTVYIFSLIGLVCQLLSDLLYHVVDPRIDFDSRI